MHAAVGAALVEMVCNLTIGKPAHAQHEPVMKAALDEAAGLRARAVRLAELDARAFGAVAAAYRLPKDTDRAREARSARIQEALVDAAELPLEAGRVAGDAAATWAFQACAGPAGCSEKLTS